MNHGRVVDGHEGRYHISDELYVLGMPAEGAVGVTRDLSLNLKAKLYRGLADPSRLAILEALRDGERTVSDLVAATGLSQPNTSAHLACLKGCGLATSRQEGRFVYYDIADARMVHILRAVEDLLDDVAPRVAACTRQDLMGGADGHRN